MPFGGSKTFGFSNEIIPFLVISGEGNGVGVFVYNGTPEFGNPPIAWLTNGSLVDPYGNPLPAVMGISGVGEFSAGAATITPSGLFLYNSSGQLAFSFSPVSGGTDPRNGGPYIPGVWAYNTGSPGTAGIGFVNIGGTAGLELPPSGSTKNVDPPQVTSFVDNAGLVNEFVGIQINSGIQSGPGGNTAIDLFSESADATFATAGALVTTGVQILTWATGGVIVSTGNGTMRGRPDFTQTDITIDTNANLTGPNPATMQWSIPANDAQIGTAYIIESEFNFTTGSTAETFGFKPSFNGAAVTTSNGDIIGSTALAVSTGYTGEVRCILKIRTTGTAGTADVYIKGGVALEGNLQGTVDTWFLSSQATAIAINTTIANTIAIDSVWGGNPSGSAQTVSNRGSTFTRRGP